MNSGLNRLTVLTMAGLILCLSYAAAEEQIILSRIDSQCHRTRAEFQVPSGQVAQHFRISQLDQGVGCETGSLIDYQRFAIMNVETEKIVYRYDQPRGGSPRETPVVLSRLALGPGKYMLSVAGGAGAVCALRFQFSSTSAAAPGFGSVKALIDQKCLPQCGSFVVAAFTGAKNFRRRGLDSGYNCHTGARIEMKSFRVENTDTGKTVFRYVFYDEQNIVEWPVKLSQLGLGPGNYRLCVSGGKGAFCILEYDIVARPGAVPPPPSPLRPPKSSAPPAQPGNKQDEVVTKPGTVPPPPSPPESTPPPKSIPPPAQPGVEQDVQDEIWIEGVSIIQTLEEFEKHVGDLEALIGSVTSLEAAALVRQEIERLESETRSTFNSLTSLKERADREGMSLEELEELLEEDWNQLEDRPRNLLSDFRLLEGHLDTVEKGLREQRDREEEEADTTTAEIKKWLRYAQDYSQKNRIALDVEKLRAEMEKNVLQSISAQATFYQHLFSRYVQCIVQAAQKRSKCKVSGSVTSLKVETFTRRITFEYVITEECPERTYRNPGRGGTTFEQLERWVKDSCRTP